MNESSDQNHDDDDAADEKKKGARAIEASARPLAAGCWGRASD